MREYVMVVLTGIGVVSPLGENAGTVHTRLVEGESGVGPLRRFVPADGRVHTGAEVGELAPLTGVGPGEKYLDRYGRMGLTAIVRAVADAGLAPGGDGEPLGIVLGAWLPAAATIQHFVDAYDAEGLQAASPMEFANCAFNAVASQAGIRLKLGPVNVTTIAGAVSGLAALEFAWWQLATGAAARLLVVGVQEMNATTYACCAGDALLAPSGSRPFDRARDGMALGEGACALVLERGDAARARCGRVLAEVGRPWLGYVPECRPADTEVAAAAVAAVLRDAVDQGGVVPAAVDHVSAAANGVPWLDAVEGAALLRVFADRPIVGTVKGALGEWVGVGPLLQVALAACALGSGVVPPVAGLREVDPCFERLALATRPVRRETRTAVVSSVCWSGMAGAAVVGVPGALR
jgi:3-oxoacyl-[acyl-carrier-protein] synthase II